MQEGKAMKGKMKAQLFYKPGDVRFEEIDIPEISTGQDKKRTHVRI